MTDSPRRAIFGSIAVSIAFVMELTLVPLLLPSIQDQFGLSISEVAWVFNSYGVAVAIGVLLGGWLGDLFSAKRVFTLGVVLFAAGSTWVAFADNFWTMVAGRVVQGFGGGIFSPMVPLLLTRASPKRPGKVLIVWGSVAGYVAAFAPLIFSSALIDTFGWHFAFLSFATIAIFAMITVLRSYTGEELESEKVVRPNYMTLLRSRDLMLMYIYVFCTYGSITYFLFRLPLWMSENGFQVTSIGAVLSTVWLSFSIVSTLLRNRVDSPIVRSIIFAAPVLIAVGFPIAYYTGNVVAFFVAAICVGSGLACSNAPSTQMILKFAPRGMSAISASLDITFARLGGVATVSILANADINGALTAIVCMAIVALVAVGMCVKKAVVAS